MLLRNIIAVIRWNWGSLASKRVLGTSTCAAEQLRIFAPFIAATLSIRRSRSRTFLRASYRSALLSRYEETHTSASSKMWPSSCWIYLLLGVLYLAPVQRVMACSCMLEHPQNHFCNSDFVAVVKVRKILPVNEYEIAYKVKINRVFKSSPKADIALKQNLLWTASMNSACGVTNFHVGETYVITGSVISGKPRISICQLSMRWADVTSRQRKAFRLFYQRGCVCEISYTPWWRKGAALESAGGKRCLWESTPGPWDCQKNFGVCMMAPGGCSWIPSIPYKYCIKEHQREREQKRAMEP